MHSRNNTRARHLTFIKFVRCKFLVGIFRRRKQQAGYLRSPPAHITSMRCHVQHPLTEIGWGENKGHSHCGELSSNISISVEKSPPPSPPKKVQKNSNIFVYPNWPRELKKNNLLLDHVLIIGLSIKFIKV